MCVRACVYVWSTSVKINLNLWMQKSQALSRPGTKLSNIRGPSVCNLLHVTFVSRRFFRSLPDFWKMCAPLLQSYLVILEAIFCGISQITYVCICICVHVCMYIHLPYVIYFISEEVMHWWRLCRVTTSGIDVRQWLHNCRFPWLQWSLVDVWHRYKSRPPTMNKIFQSGVSDLFFAMWFEKLRFMIQNDVTSRKPLIRLTVGVWPSHKLK